MTIVDRTNHEVVPRQAEEVVTKRPHFCGEDMLQWVANTAKQGRISSS